MYLAAAKTGCVVELVNCRKYGTMVVRKNFLLGGPRAYIP